VSVAQYDAADTEGSGSAQQTQVMSLQEELIDCGDSPKAG
jgi:hypothetical protein